ncbi:MAG: DUF1499 domain-containing protein [Nitrospirota bacterium]
MLPSSVTIALSCSLVLIGCTGARPANLGVHDGNLQPCPSSPNCVSSRSTDREHAVEPLRFSGPAPEAMTALGAVISKMKRASIVTLTGSYLHAEFTSAVFRFVDDAEFLLDDETSTIHVRSASRVGSSDLGVNRRRIEAIRQAWHALPIAAPTSPR